MEQACGDCPGGVDTGAPSRHSVKECEEEETTTASQNHPLKEPIVGVEIEQRHGYHRVGKHEDVFQIELLLGIEQSLHAEMRIEPFYEP